MASNTYTAVGNKEDVSDIITNIAPYDTPPVHANREDKEITKQPSVAES